MNEKRAWIAVAAGSLAGIAGLGFGAHTEQLGIDASREQITQLKLEIASARETISGTPGLERDVIVLRELSEVVDEVLPATEELKNLINDFRDYAVAAGVEVNSFKPKPSRPSAPTSGTDFDRVTYTLLFKGGTFEFLDFLNRIESDKRFMSVPFFKIRSGTRKEMEDAGQAQHEIEMEVEAYAYTRKNDVPEVRIDSYERKRDLLAGTINSRRKEFIPRRYNYRGDRGRRDPWVDPRVADTSLDGGMSIQEQVKMVEQLIELVVIAEGQWQALDEAANTIDRMLKRTDLDRTLAELDEELRRVDADGVVSYLPAARSLELEVVEPRLALRTRLENERIDGPSRIELVAVIDSMGRHARSGEYSLAIEAFEAIQPALSEIIEDPVREGLALELESMLEECTTARDFASIELDFGGVVILEGRPPKVLINGRTYSVGDLVTQGLEIAGIHPEEIVFFYRGFELTRVY